MRLFLILVVLFSTVYSNVSRLHIIKSEYDVAKYLLLHPTDYNIRYTKEIIRASRKYDLVYTMLAISIHESRLGKYLTNNRGDYCYMHVNAGWYLRDMGMRSTYWKKLEIGSSLIRDDKLCIDAAIQNILRWKIIYNNKWRTIWGCYNGGTTPNYRYSNYIYSIIQAIKWYEFRYSCKFRNGSCLRVMQSMLD